MPYIPSQPTPERSYGPEQQARQIRDAIRERSVQNVLALIPEDIPMQEVPVHRPTVLTQPENPIVRQALTQPTFHEDASRLVREAFGE